MWPFATRGSRFLGEAADRHPSRLNPEDFARNDAVIKLWLPERLLAAIDVLCDAHDASRPEMVARYPASLITVGLARGLHFFDRRLPWNEGCEGQPP